MNQYQIWHGPDPVACVYFLRQVDSWRLRKDVCSPKWQWQSHPVGSVTVEPPPCYSLFCATTNNRFCVLKGSLLLDKNKRWLKSLQGHDLMLPPTSDQLLWTSALWDINLLSVFSQCESIQFKCLNSRNACREYKTTIQQHPFLSFPVGPILLNWCWKSTY